MHPRYSSSWYDPQTARSLATTLVNENMDTVVGGMDSAAGPRAAADEGVWTGGQWNRMRDTLGEEYLTNPVALWEPYYDRRIQQARDENWESSATWGGLGDMVTVDDYGPQITDEAVAEADAALEALRSGELNVWDGTKFEDWSTEPGGRIEKEMGSYVDGVVGEPPN